MKNKGSALIVGGGISGVTCALELAECGARVWLVEKEDFLGGRVAGMNKYFPKLCPPLCGLEINFRRLRANRNVTVFTRSEIADITRSDGAFNVVIKTSPRYVNDKCVACGDCEKVCPASGPDNFNHGMSQARAIRLPHPMAMPMRYAIDMSVCSAQSCAKCVSACEYGAIELGMEERETRVSVDAVIYATGWKPYDAEKIENLGYGKFRNVITNVEMERLAAPNGPANGRILRRDNGEPVKTVAFVQCAGSRDESHLPYCSSVCCLASLKQATYVREQYPSAQIYIFYIDLRAPGKYETFYKKIASDPGIKLVKGKVARIEAGCSGRVMVVAEDILGGEKIRVECDLVTLAVGMEPSMKGADAVKLLKMTDDGFMTEDIQLSDGVIPAGVAISPFDVPTSIQSATGAALKAMGRYAKKTIAI